MNWIVAIALLVIICILLEREIYFYEAVHLGPRIQAWLYDRWSKKYDEGKRASQQDDNELLAQPLITALNAASLSTPWVLDFATGTGRLSYALLSRPDFHGRILALDLSQGMLEQAASKLCSYLDGSSTEQKDTIPALPARVELLRQPALPLPFPDATFDVVCALEVLELFPSMEPPLAELTRVLRPGGMLLTSRGTEQSGRKAKIKSEKEMAILLQQNGLENVQITSWWKLFDRVIARKSGFSSTIEVQSLSAVMRCPSCAQTRWQRLEGAWKCLNCGKELSITNQSIVLNCV